MTSEAEHCDKYCVLIWSASGIKKAAVYACSGESTTSVNKWGMDYYALVKISADGKVLEKFLESDNLKLPGKKGGVNGIFTDFFI